MSSAVPLAGSSAGLLVDTNLLVLWVVGGVNRNRIETFKRTSNYTKTDYDFLRRVLASFDPLYTVPHVLAEVSNLTDLPDAERQQARHFLKRTISLLNEAEISSAFAAEDALYLEVGLVDAAIGMVARGHNCTVLTDDQELYLRLSDERVSVIYFRYLRERGLRD
jgi:rRNA-processing protein FCF1